jgi:hypothetical protein
MADKKVSQLTALTGAGTASGDLLYIVDVSEPVAADQSKKITLTEFQSAPVSAGTANGVAYLNASKVLTTGSALTFDGSQIALGTATANIQLTTTVNTNQAYISLADADGRTAVFRGPNSGSPNAAQIGTTTNHELVFLYGNAEQMRLTSTGLGIGTSSPGAKLDVNGDASIYGVTVGRGAGAVSTNTAVGAGALQANTTGASNLALGANALYANITGDFNTAVGASALQSNTTSYNTALGFRAAYLTTTGQGNLAVGAYALNTNTTGGGNTAVGNWYAGVISAALYGNTTGVQNTAVGSGALSGNSTGSNNTVVGFAALASNTTASNNTAVGYQAGYSQTTADGNALFGYQAGTSLTTGNLNSFVGAAAGGAITTGSKNTILGRYNGNQGGLDIRTADNYIVLSDGDGNPRATWFPNGWVFGYPNYTPPTDEQVVAVDNASGSMSAFLAAASPNGGQAGLRLRAGVGTTYRATRIDFYQTPASTTVPRWTLINDYNQDNSNDFRLYSGVYGNPVQTWKADGTTSVYNTLGVGNAAGSTSGAGITFPATQSASSNANTLDDYERGTFTATLKGQISDPTTPVTTTGYYTKIGNLVYVKVGFESVDTTGGSGGAYISGLPFLNVNARAFGSVGSYGGLAWNYQVTSMVSTGANYIDLMDIRSANIWTNATINVSASAYIWATVTYTVV